MPVEKQMGRGEGNERGVLEVQASERESVAWSEWMEQSLGLAGSSVSAAQRSPRAARASIRFGHTHPAKLTTSVAQTAYTKTRSSSRGTDWAELHDEGPSLDWGCDCLGQAPLSLSAYATTLTTRPPNQPRHAHARHRHHINSS